MFLWIRVMPLRVLFRHLVLHLFILLSSRRNMILLGKMIVERVEAVLIYLGTWRKNWHGCFG